MPEGEQICWVCEEMGECPYPICYPEEEREERFPDWEAPLPEQTQLELEL